jgi:hypothetical protein
MPGIFCEQWAPRSCTGFGSRVVSNFFTNHDLGRWVASNLLQDSSSNDPNMYGGQTHDISCGAAAASTIPLHSRTPPSVVTRVTCHYSLLSHYQQTGRLTRGAAGNGDDCTKKVTWPLAAHACAHHGHSSASHENLRRQYPPRNENEVLVEAA